MNNNLVLYHYNTTSTAAPSLDQGYRPCLTA